jgi:hypothetical protein
MNENRIVELVGRIAAENHSKPKQEKPKLMEGFEYIPGFGEYYSISEFGEIFSHRRNTFIKPYTSKIGYKVTLLYKDNRKDRKHYFVHQLVAETYLEKPAYKCEINHIDGNKTNNHVSNLEWVTHQQNMQHAHNTEFYDKSICFQDWSDWTPSQLAKFERSPYNIPASGPYEYPFDLQKQIVLLPVYEKQAVSF